MHIRLLDAGSGRAVRPLPWGSPVWRVERALKVPADLADDSTYRPSVDAAAVQK
jgi:hypothetical protein